MTYDELLDIANDNGLIVREKPLQAYDGRIKGNRVAIRKNMPTVKKACVLAEEISHDLITVGNILQQEIIQDVKQEYKARFLSFDMMIGLDGIIKSFENECTTLTDMADFLEVTTEFLVQAIESYKSKYGICTKYKGYTIYFEPTLGVYKSFGGDNPAIADY